MRPPPCGEDETGSDTKGQGKASGEEARPIDEEAISDCFTSLPETNPKISVAEEAVWREETMSGAIRDSKAGNFATSRRGGLSNEDIRTAYDLRAKGRSIQHISAYLGRSSIDIQALIGSVEVAQASAQNIIVTPPEPQSGGQSLQFTPEQIIILTRVDNGLQSGRSAAREIGCSQQAVRHWIANNRMRRDVRPNRHGGSRLHRPEGATA